MALTDIVAGTTGAVTASGFNAALESWAATINTPTVTSRTLDAEWLTSDIVSAQLTGSFTGKIQFDAASSSPVPSSLSGYKNVSFTLTATTGCTFTFTGNVTSVALTRSSVDHMRGTFNFESDGEVTVAWDETA